MRGNFMDRQPSFMHTQQILAVSGLRDRLATGRRGLHHSVPVQLNQNKTEKNIGFREGETASVSRAYLLRRFEFPGLARCLAWTQRINGAEVRLGSAESGASINLS